MAALVTFLAALTMLLWLGFVLSPWASWRNREMLDTTNEGDSEEFLDETTVVVPARNEAGVIQPALQSINAQGPELKIILIDDGSQDATVAEVHALGLANVHILHSAPLPPDWSGKVWAL